MRTALLLRLLRQRLLGIAFPPAGLAWDIVGRANLIEVNAAPPAIVPPPPVATGGANQITITG